MDPTCTSLEVHGASYLFYGDISSHIAPRECNLVVVFVHYPRLLSSVISSFLLSTDLFAEAIDGLELRD